MAMGSWCTEMNEDSDDIDAVEDCYPPVTNQQRRDEFYDTSSLIDVDRIVQLYEKYHEIPQEICEKLENLVINISWDLPPAHTLKNTLRNCEHGGLINTLKESGIQVKLDCFTREEEKMVLENWELFKKEYGFENPKYFLPGFVKKKIFSNYEKNKFTQYLARGLPSRTLRSVYNKFHELFNETKTGRFITDDDKTILAVYRTDPRYFGAVSQLKILETVLKRKKTPIYRRYLKLKKNEQKNEEYTQNIDWDLNTCESLICNMMDCKNVNDVRNLERITVSDKEWKEISDDLGLCPIQAKMFWISHLSAMLFTKWPVSRNVLRSILIRWFHQHREIKKWSDVLWINISGNLFVPPFLLYKTFRKMVTTYVPPRMWPNLRGCVRHLYKHYLKLFSGKKLKDHRLQRLKFTKDRKLIEIDNED